MKRIVRRGYSPAQRLEMQSDRSGGPDACWNWTGCLLDNKMGYGQITAWGRSHPAHKLAWILQNGPVPRGLLVCHKCDNPLCVNVAHLFLGTQATNRQDCVSKNRQHKPKGELNHECKLTEDQVKEIRRLEGTQSRKKTAKKFKISVNHVGAIVRREKWSHL